MVAKTRETRLEFTSFHLSVRYKGMFFPFDLMQFIRVVPQQGYVVVRDIPSLPAGTKLGDMSGELARKGDVELRINTLRNVVALQTNSIVGAIDELENLENFMEQQMDFDSRRKALFYELMGDVIASVGGDALRAIGSQFEGLPLIKRVSGIMGQPVSNFTLHLVPVGGKPNEVEWLDLRIEPLIAEPERKLAVFVVLRSAERSKVMEFGKGLPVLLQRVIAELKLGG